MIDINAILATAVENEASDVHINVGIPPVLRKNTELIDLDLSPVTNEDAKEMIVSMVGAERFKKYLENKDLDFSTSIEDGTRFRVNAHVQKDTIAISFRVIPNQAADFHIRRLIVDLLASPGRQGLHLDAENLGDLVRRQQAVAVHFTQHGVE